MEVIAKSENFRLVQLDERRGVVIDQDKRRVNPPGYLADYLDAPDWLPAADDPELIADAKGWNGGRFLTTV